MRKSLLACLAAAFVLTLADGGSAQQPDEIKPEDLRPQKPQKTKIEKVRFGFVGGGVTRQASAFGDFKAGCWTPVYVDVIVGSEDLPNGRIIIEGTDCDDVKNTYTVPLPPLKRGESHQVTGYTKPSAYDTEITITLMAGRDRLVERKESPNALDIGNVLFLAAGARLQGLVRALAPPGLPAINEDDPLIDAGQTKGRFVGYLDDVRQLPSRWFGYEGADVVFLLTGDRNFVEGLLNDHTVNKDASRFAALAEWVRRGGQLVVCVGRNQDVVAALDARQPVLPVRPAGANAEPDLTWLRALAPNDPLPAAGLPVTRFEPKPGQEFRVEGSRDLKQALVVRGRHGLGRVMVVGFDPEQAPFTRWRGQTAFWNWYLENRAPQALSQYRAGRTWQQGAEQPELASQLQQSLENFEDVPVISFGWVALFILLYILIVGPLDYFFLKKVVKRLELTWITFPVVVIVISAAAYFTAYYVKGNDQRINKVDLVDIDLSGKQAQLYGQSWFTIFSPRIQHYTIGVDPAADAGWVPADRTSTVVSWLGRPDNSPMGVRRSRSPSLFRRTYEFEPDLSGMRGVPIPVWSTKSFVASWATTDAVPAPFDAEITAAAANPNQLTGRITSKLPVALDDAVLVRHNGAEVLVYHVGTLVPGAERNLANLFRESDSKRAEWLTTQWAGRQARAPEPGEKQGPGRGTHSPTSMFVTQFLFHAALRNAPGSERHNAAVRHLDQSWRLTGREVILFGRVQRVEKGAEDVTRDARSPTHLWLGHLPGSGAPRPSLNGTLSQETYVRVFIPIRTGSE